MRVTGGQLCGQRIRVPRGRAVRPTQDRVREALFSCLFGRIDGSRFLDLFAGSGAVGLEAWSRGAEYVCWVESAPRVIPILKENVTRLCDATVGRELRIVRRDATRFLDGDVIGAPYDIIFADPPYDRGGKLEPARKALQALSASPILASNGVVVIEQSTDQPVSEHENWILAQQKTYGDTRLLFYGQ